jgi:tetratricopeptide (TPR) repeat protein
MVRRELPDYTCIVTRLLLASLFLVIQATAFTPQQPEIQEPPEEDLSNAEKVEYTFNPLQAEKELKIGNFYFKKGSYRAAARRFEEAGKWNPSSGEAFLRLGDARARMGSAKAANEAYLKYLELEPESKRADEIRRKLKSLK